MITDIEKKEEEIKSIWLENKESKKMGEIFVQLLQDYFPEETKESNYKVTKGWLFFMRLVKKWKSEGGNINIDRSLETFSDEEIDDVQDDNRRRMILMLRKYLKEYERNPNKLTAAKSGELRRLYDSIQKSEEAKKRTAIQKGKLGLDAVKTLLPYQRLSLPQLLELKEKINESFQRIIDLKSEKSSGQNIISSG